MQCIGHKHCQPSWFLLPSKPTSIPCSPTSSGIPAVTSTPHFISVPGFRSLHKPPLYTVFLSQAVCRNLSGFYAHALSHEVRAFLIFSGCQGDNSQKEPASGLRPSCCDRTGRGQVGSEEVGKHSLLSTCICNPSGKGQKGLAQVL